MSMRVQKIGQSENNNRRQGVVKAGVTGVIGGALVRNLAPLTKNEHDTFFNSSALNGIKTKVQKVRVNEANKIVEELADHSLLVSKEAGDIFTKNASIIAINPENANGAFKNASDTVKEQGRKLIERVMSVGAAKEQTEINNIKNAAKQARPLALFIGVGAAIAVASKVAINTFKSVLPKKEEEEPQNNGKLTIADALLEGLGSNTEVLLLSTSSKK